jgi:hypothetical protein
LEIGFDVGKIIAHALRVVADTCNGIFAVYVVGVDLTGHTGSLY